MASTRFSGKCTHSAMKKAGGSFHPRHAAFENNLHFLRFYENFTVAERVDLDMVATYCRIWLCLAKHRPCAGKCADRMRNNCK
jgi:hypothetical protein